MKTCSIRKRNLHMFYLTKADFDLEITYEKSRNSLKYILSTPKSKCQSSFNDSTRETFLGNRVVQKRETLGAILLLQPPHPGLEQQQQQQQWLKVAAPISHWPWAVSSGSPSSLNLLLLLVSTTRMTSMKHFTVELPLDSLPPSHGTSHLL